MKFVRFFAVACALTLLAAATAQAITPKDFFSTKSQNMEMVIFVIGQSEMGGVDGQLQRAQESLALAKGESEARKKLKHAKMAWFYAFHAAFLTDTAVPKEEQGKYHQAVGNVLAGAAQVLLISQENFEPLMTGTVTLFGEGEQRLQAQMRADEGPVTAKADEYYEAHAAESTAQKATPGDSKATKFEAIFSESKAKVQTATGRPFPIDTNDRNIINALIRAQGANPLKIDDVNSGDQLRIISASIKNSTENLKSMGFSLEATLLYTLDNIERSGYGYWAALHRHRRLDLLMPYFSIYENPEYIKPLLENGVISKQAARRLIDFRQIFNELYGTKF